MMLNPVLRREARTSLRNWKFFGAITLYVAIVAFGAGFYVYSNMFQSYYYGFDPQSVIGLYGILCAMQMGLIMIATPALTAGSISGERERQTLDLLLVTKMSSYSIIFGKLLSSMGIILLMTISILPIFAIVFYFGGVSLIPLLGMMGFMLLTACAVAAVSVFLSCVFKKTMLSMVLVYLIMGFLCFGTLLAVVMYHSIYWSMYQQEPRILVGVLLLAGNPGVGFFSIIDGQIGTDFVRNVMNVYPTMNGLLRWIVSHYWAVNALVDVAAIVIFTSLAAHFINPVRGKK